MLAKLSVTMAAWWDTAWVGLSTTGKVMLILGLAGQSLFVLRWFVQLAASEKAKKSVVPEVFWYLSLAGALLVFVYAIYIANLVLMLGQFGLFIYARNVYLLWRPRPTGEAPPAVTGATER